MAVQPTNSKCCHCIDRRTGAIVIAIMHILGAFGVLVCGIFLAHLMLSQDGPSSNDGLDGLEYGIFCGSIIGVIVGLIAGATLLIGAIKHNTTAILFHIVLAAIEILDLFAIAIIILVITNGADLDDPFAGLAALICYICCFSAFFHASIYICFFVCIYNFYKEIKSRTIIPACIT